MKQKPHIALGTMRSETEEGGIGEERKGGRIKGISDVNWGVSGGSGHTSREMFQMMLFI